MGGWRSKGEGAMPLQGEPRASPRLEVRLVGLLSGIVNPSLRPASHAPPARGQPRARRTIPRSPD
eukprot:scaffold31949_cov146-Isochrysis_galbana.AAC.4